MKTYLLLDIDDEDGYQPLAVCSTKERAEELKKVFIKKERLPKYRQLNISIEEWPINELQY